MKPVIIQNYILGIFAIVFFYLALMKTLIPIWVKKSISLRKVDLELEIAKFGIFKLLGTRQECRKLLGYIIFIDLMQNEEYSIDYYKKKYSKDYEDIDDEFPVWKIKLMIKANKKIVFWEHELEI